MIDQQKAFEPIPQLPKPPELKQLPLPGKTWINESIIDLDHIIEPPDNINPGNFFDEYLKPDQDHFLLNWGHSQSAYNNGLGPILQDMTYEVKFSQQSSETKPATTRFVNIDIAKLVADPRFQNDTGLSNKLLMLVYDEIGNLEAVELKYFEDYLETIPDDEANKIRRKKILESISYGKQRIETNKIRYRSAQHLLDECQKAGIDLSGLPYGRIISESSPAE